MSCLLQSCFPCPPIGCANPCFPCPPCNPCAPCFDPCFPCVNPCFPCWPCKPCPCPPPEKLGIPQAFPDIPKKKKGKGKKKKPSNSEKSTSSSNIEVEDVAIGNPCRCCKRCMCMGPKPDQPCYVGIGQCCKACPCNGCRSCAPPPCPPPACTCKAPPQKICTCSNTRSKLTNSSPKACSCGKGGDEMCGESCKAAQMDTELVKCEVCGHRKRVAKSPMNNPSMPARTYDDATVSGLRKGPVPYACCKSSDVLESRFKPPDNTRNSVKTCNGCGKEKPAPKLCSGCRSLGF